MTGSHTAYIAAAYILAIGAPLLMSITGLARVRAARRKLAAVDPRGDRGWK